MSPQKVPLNQLVKLICDICLHNLAIHTKLDPEFKVCELCQLKINKWAKSREKEIK